MRRLSRLVEILKESGDSWRGLEARPKVEQKEDIILRDAAKTFHLLKSAECNSNYEDRTGMSMYLDDTDDILAMRKV